MALAQGLKPATQDQDNSICQRNRTSMYRAIVTDITQPITAEHIEQAIGILIQRHDTHFDSLAERLQEEWVQRVLAPILAGSLLDRMPEDDR